MNTPVPGRGAETNPIIVEVPVQLNSLVQPIRALIDEVESVIRSARGGHAVDYASIESTIAEKTAAIERGAHEAQLRSLDVDAPRVEINGKPYNRIGHSSATFKTMAGPIQVRRAQYREAGVRNPKAVDAISLRVGGQIGGTSGKTGGVDGGPS